MGTPRAPHAPSPLCYPRRGRNAAGWRSRAAGTAPQPCVRHCGTAISISTDSPGSHPARPHAGAHLRVSLSRRLSRHGPETPAASPSSPTPAGGPPQRGIPSAAVSGTWGATSLQPPGAGDHPRALSGRGARVFNYWHGEGTPCKRYF